MKGKMFFSIFIVFACLLMGVPSPAWAAENVPAGKAIEAKAPTAAEPYTLTAEDVNVDRCRENDRDSNTPFIDAVSISWKGGIDLSQPKYKNIVIPDTLPFDKPVLDEEGKEQRDEKDNVITVTVNMPVIKAFLNPGEFGRGNLEKVTVSKNVQILGDFSGCERLSEVVIPEDSAVEAFSADAFSQTAIRTLFVPVNVTELPERMFYRCKDLETVTFAEGSKLTKIGAYALAESGLTTIDVPDGVTEFGEYAFLNCDLAEILLPDAMEVLPQYAFAYCTSLKKVSFGSGLTEIGEAAFTHTAIEELVIPDTITLIGWGAFNDIEALRTVHFGSGLKEIGGCSDLGEYTRSIFQNDVNVETVVFSEGLEKIGDGLFQQSGKIESLVIPSTVKHIGRAAFGGFSGFSGIEVHALSVLTFAEPSQLENIFPYAFSFNSLRHLTLPTAAQPFKIWDSAFEANAELLDVDLGNCQELGSDTGYSGEEVYETNAAVFGAFKDCAKLRTVKLSDELTIIHHGSFMNCASLLGPLVFPVGLQKIGHSAFEGCSSIEDVTFNEGLETIGNLAFCGCDLHTISLPDTVTAVGNRCFEGNVHAGSVKFSALMTVIPDRFLDCYSEGNAAYSVSHGSMTGVGTHGILKELVIPDNIKEIGIDAFDGCFDLETLDLGQVEYIGTGAFSCPDLLTDTVGRLGALKTVVMSPALKEIGTLPPHCTKMDSAFAEVFHGQGSFDGLVLPATLEKVSAYAFAGCTALRDFTVTENLKAVGSHAFDGCANLTALAFADTGNTKFGDEVFKDCKSLTRVALPSWLETVPVGMFSGCGKLTDVALSEGILELGGMAFADTGLTAVTLPESCLYIGASVFQNAPVKNVHFGSQTVSIGANAFVRDTNVHLMASVFLPESVRSVGERAFGYYKRIDKNYEALCAEAERLEAETGELVDVQSLIPPTIANNDFILCGGAAAKRYAEENEMVYGGTEPVVVPDPEISAASASLKAGETKTLKVTGAAVESWSSSKKTVATVTKEGKVTALRKGTAVITATLPTGAALTCKVTVTTSPTIRIGEKEFSADTTYKITKNKTLTVYITGKAAGVKNVYATSDSTIARIVSETTEEVIKIRAYEKGSATVSFKVNGVIFRIKVQVTEPARISASSATLKAGAVRTLKVTGGTVKSWSSSKKAVAAVTKAGKVTALRKGTATITATLTTGKTLTCKVTVSTNPTLMIGDKAFSAKTTYTIRKNKTLTVSITGKASGVNNVYATSDSAIARITSKTTAEIFKIKAYEKGSATVSLKVNGVVFRIKVKVK